MQLPGERVATEIIGESLPSPAQLVEFGAPLGDQAVLVHRLGTLGAVDALEAALATCCRGFPAIARHTVLTLLHVAKRLLSATPRETDRDLHRAPPSCCQSRPRCAG